jgi:hypothetical protein
MDNDNNLQLLEDYLDGNLGKTDTETVEEKLKNDPDLREMFVLLQASTQGIKLAGRQETIRKIHTEFINEARADRKKSNKKTLRISPWWMGIAASVALLLTFTTVNLSRFPDSFLSKNAIVYELPTMRGGGNETDLLEAAFREKNWEVLLEKVDPMDTNRRALFLASMAALQAEQFDLGLQYLEALDLQNSRQSEPLFENEIAYYRLVFLLHQEAYGQALAAWQALDAQDENPYRNSIGTMDKASLWILGKF